MCKVLNKHTSGVPQDAIYIGRGSKWGNPFRIGPDGDRATVIAKHERWLRAQDDLLRALDELRGRDLVCFCAGSPTPRALNGLHGGAACCIGDSLFPTARVKTCPEWPGAPAFHRRHATQTHRRASCH